MMKAFADQRKAKPVFRRHAPAARVDQAGWAPCLQRGQIRQILDSPRPQFKLTISAPDDAYEQEADRVADQVMRMPDPMVGAQRVQRMCPNCEEELQRQPVEEEERPEAEKTAGTSDLMSLKPIPGTSRATRPYPSSDGAELSPQLENTVRSLRDRGRPLESSARTFFEHRFGQDFQHVQVHADERAAELARAVHAHAFTLGDDMVFGWGEYRPHSHEGRWLVAHELTHVLQQRGQPAALRRKKLCDCPKLGLEAPKSTQGTFLKGHFPHLDNTDWCITGKKTPKYNCFAWSVGVTSKWMDMSIDKDFGDKDDRLEISDFDALYAAKGLKPVRKDMTPSNPEVALYGTATGPTHAAKKSYRTCSGVSMFESKLGKYYRIIHPVRDLEKGMYGDIVRWYIKK